jgi:FXSXX-COOH protein
MNTDVKETTVNINASDPTESGTRESDLTDVSLVSLAELFASKETVLAVALRRVVGEVERSAQAISGWSSYVDGTSPSTEASY